MVLLLLLCSFEYPGHVGQSSAMIAGAAVADGQHSFFLNPALCTEQGWLQAAVHYSRPYVLPGLSWSRAGGVWSSSRLATGVAFSSLGLAGYREHDASVVVGGMPIPAVGVGLGIHALIVDAGSEYDDIVPSFDAGACWESGRVRVAAAGLRLNSPRWREGSSLPAKFVLGGSWSPVEDLLIALDLSREGEDEDAAFGAEFRPIPQLGLRIGVGAAPLRYAAGLEAWVGPLGLEYAYQFHPTLKESHVLGLRTAWH